MNRLSSQDRATVISALCEGCSISSIVRMTGISKVTILKLLLTTGDACAAFEDKHIRNLPCLIIEADEVWGFSGSKDRNVRPENRGNPDWGSVWTWVALCANTKMILSWTMGDRNQKHADAFMRDLRSRLSGCPQITTDALGAYSGAVRKAFGIGGVDYAIVKKLYGKEQDEIRYSPAKCIGCEKMSVYGMPDKKLASTSFVERSNLTLRMSQRRWTRLTNAHSKTFRHMQAAFAIHSFHYNWVRRHMTIKTAPAVAMNLVSAPLTVADMVGIVEKWEAAQKAGKI